MNMETKTQHFIITNFTANSHLGFTHSAELSLVKGHLGISKDGVLFEQCKTSARKSHFHAGNVAHSGTSYRKNQLTCLRLKLNQTAHIQYVCIAPV